MGGADEPSKPRCRLGGPVDKRYYIWIVAGGASLLLPLWAHGRDDRLFTGAVLFAALGCVLLLAATKEVLSERWLELSRDEIALVRAVAGIVIGRSSMLRAPSVTLCARHLRTTPRGTEVWEIGLGGGSGQRLAWLAHERGAARREVSAVEAFLSERGVDSAVTFPDD